MDVTTIDVEPRAAGKKAARQIRRNGRVPCVLYGRGEQTVHFSIDGHSLHRLVFTDELHTLKLNLEGQSFDCILKDFDMHPVKGEPVHADFQMLVEGQEIELDVPIQFVGTAKGQKEGGDVQYIVHELTVLCLPRDIPDNLVVDVTHLDIGDTIHVSELSFENLTMVTPGRQTVVAVTAKKAEEVEEPVDELEGLLEGEEGEAVEGDEQEASDDEKDEE